MYERRRTIIKLSAWTSWCRVLTVTVSLAALLASLPDPSLAGSSLRYDKSYGAYKLGNKHGSYNYYYDHKSSYGYKKSYGKHKYYYRYGHKYYSGYRLHYYRPYYSYYPYHGDLFSFGYGYNYPGYYVVRPSQPVYIAPAPPNGRPPVAPPERKTAMQLGDCLMVREYQTKITVDGKNVDAYGDACLQTDGSWRRGPPKPVPN